MKKSEEQEKGSDIFSVVIKNSARKFLEKIDDKNFAGIDKKILALKIKPFPRNSKKLIASDFHRIRAGNYRVLYSVDTSDFVVTILDIDNRKDIYKKK